MAKFSRKGLHRVTCDECQAFAYYTIATLETRGLPRCGWCADSTMRPERYELALALGVSHPADEIIERDGYHREMSQTRALRGYQRAEERKAGIGGSVPANMHHRALAAYLEREDESARLRRGRRAVSLVPVVEPMAF
jgi:hypothetical protein